MDPWMFATIFLIVMTLFGGIWSAFRELMIREMTKEHSRISMEAISSLKDISGSVHSLRDQIAHMSIEHKNELLQSIKLVEMRVEVGMESLRQSHVNVDFHAEGRAQINQGDHVRGDQS